MKSNLVQFTNYIFDSQTFRWWSFLHFPLCFNFINCLSNANNNNSGIWTRQQNTTVDGLIILMYAKFRETKTFFCSSILYYGQTPTLVYEIHSLHQTLYIQFSNDLRYVCLYDVSLWYFCRVKISWLWSWHCVLISLFKFFLTFRDIEIFGIHIELEHNGKKNSDTLNTVKYFNNKIQNLTENMEFNGSSFMSWQVDYILLYLLNLILTKTRIFPYFYLTTD